MTDTAPVPRPPGPEAERDLLQATALRRRQLLNALLHGSARSWRAHRPVWPALLLGIGLAAVIVAGMAVKRAFDEQRAPHGGPATPMCGRRCAAPSPTVPAGGSEGVAPATPPAATPPGYLPPGRATPSDIPGRTRDPPVGVPPRGEGAEAGR